MMKLKTSSCNRYRCDHPIGNNLQEFWKNLLNGVSGANLITQFDASKFKTRFACELKNFDPLNYPRQKGSPKN